MLIVPFSLRYTFSPPASQGTTISSTLSWQIDGPTESAVGLVCGDHTVRSNWPKAQWSRADWPTLLVQITKWKMSVFALFLLIVYEWSSWDKAGISELDDTLTARRVLSPYPPPPPTPVFFFLFFFLFSFSFCFVREKADTLCGNQTALIMIISTEICKAPTMRLKRT